jgi:hypothetical protein
MFTSVQLWKLLNVANIKKPNRTYSISRVLFKEQTLRPEGLIKPDKLIPSSERVVAAF